MGISTGIQWADHTFNPWRGCQKVSTGCAHCYAERLSVRNPAVLGEWGGPETRRSIAAESGWKRPLAWDSAAGRDGVRRRVFFSLGDWLENRPDLDAPLARLLKLTRNTPHLDWLLLTKRPENFHKRIWAAAKTAENPIPVGWAHNWTDQQQSSPNIWIGVSAETQRHLEKRAWDLRRIPSPVRFLSAEPLLGPLEIRPWLGDIGVFNWVIVGGESGPGARDCYPGWVRSIRDQCLEAGVPFFFKQWGGPRKSERTLDGRTWDQLPFSKDSSN